MNLLYSGSAKLLRTNLYSNMHKATYYNRVLYAKASNPSDEFAQPSLSSSYSQQQVMSNLPVVTKQSMFYKLKQFVGFQGDLKYPQPVLTIAAYRLYMSIQYQIDYDKFFKLLDSPDTMYSFCLINFVHIWLVSVPLMQFGKTGHYVRTALYKNMWSDIETRSKKLKAPMKKENKVATYQHLNDIFRGFLIGFDEGLLSDDTVLAGTVWRHLYEQAEIKDYAALGQMVDYIRKNIQHLDEINEIDYLKHGIVTFIDLDQKEIDHLKVRQTLIDKIKTKEREA